MSARVISAVLFTVVLAVLDARAVSAAHVDAVSVEADGDTYRIKLDAVVDAAQARVYGVLSDYTQLSRISPSIQSISVRPAPGNKGKRVRSVLEDCVWFFCRRIIQVEDVIQPDPFSIVGHVVPDEGDFAAGSFSWHVTAEGERTRVHYEASQVPRVWVPPLIGPWMISNVIRSRLTSSVPVLERLANESASHADVESPRASSQAGASSPAHR